MTARSSGHVQLQYGLKLRVDGSDANDTDVWYVKAGIKRAWMPAGATVLFGEWGQYNDQFSGALRQPGPQQLQRERAFR